MTEKLPQINFQSFETRAHAVPWHNKTFQHCETDGLLDQISNHCLSLKGSAFENYILYLKNHAGFPAHYLHNIVKMKCKADGVGDIDL